jgi:hypothetical protein
VNSRLVLNTNGFDWDAQASQLPETVFVNGTQVNTATLNPEAKRLLAVYLMDQQIVGQQEEFLSLAKLGLVELGNRILSAAL